MSKLTVIREGNTIVLVGHLVDSTDLGEFEALAKPELQINLSKLYTASWLGIQKLFDALVSTKLCFELIEIPSHLYRMLCTFPGFGDSIAPRSIRVELYDPSGKNDVKTIAFDELIRIAESEGCFDAGSEGLYIQDSLAHLCRPFFKKFRYPDPKNIGIWHRQNLDEALFWHDYVSFVRLIIETCAYAQEATTILIEDNLQRILMRVMNAQQAIKIFQPNFKDFSSRSLMALISDIQQKSHVVFKDIEEHANAYKLLLQKIELSFRNPAVPDFFAFVKEIVELAKALTEVTTKVDGIGFEISKDVFSFSTLDELFEVLKKTPVTEINEKTMASVRRKLKLPPLENCTWTETLADIDQEIRFLKNDSNVCIVLMQAFDLIKQVIEHRMQEGSILENNLHDLQSGKSDWRKVQEDILEAAFNKLVTDQEKYSFTFFFPDANGKKQEGLQPGEVAFF